MSRLITGIAFLLFLAPPLHAEREEIVVAVGNSFPPMVFVDAEGNPAGIDADLWRLWEKKTGVRVVLTPMDWKETIPALLDGRVDVVDGVSKTPQRESILEFSTPYGEIATYIYFHRSIGGVKEPKDLEGFRTGVIRGSNTEEWLRREAPQLVLYPCVSHEELVEAARGTHVRVFIAGEPAVGYFFGRAGGTEEFRRTEKPLFSGDLHMAVKRGNRELLDLVNRGLAAISATERNRIREEWAGVGLEAPMDLGWLLWAIGAVILVGALLLTWNAQLRRQVSRATKRIRRSEERFRSLVESTSDWIWEVDRDGVYTYVSPRVEELLGYRAEELIGKTPFDLMPAGVAEKVRKTFFETLERRAPIVSLENVNLTRDGREILLETNGRPILDERGELIGYRGVDRDITERKSLEVQLHHSQKMEAIGQLAGGVAHDFNNQLQAILGYAHMLLRRGSHEGEMRVHMEEIRKAAERAGSLTRQLLAFGRRETLQPRNLDVARLIDGLTGMLTRLIGEQIELKVSLTEPTWGVHVDPGQIEQVVMNLSINARDAMPEGGVLAIDTAEVSFDDEFCQHHHWARPGEYVEIRVTDSGTGIEPEVRDRIFEPFFTTKEVGQGTGLGLATVYAIVDRHNGLITVESEPGKGATFRVFFPSSGEPPADPEEEVAPAETEPGSGTILVAEDDAIIRELTEEVLSSAGYDLLLAPDGAEAIRLLKEHEGRIKLALLDVVMPEMGGREVHDYIRRHQPDLPVLFCSGYSYSALERGNLPAGGENLIQKPYTPDELLAKIREVLV